MMKQKYTSRELVALAAHYGCNYPYIYVHVRAAEKYGVSLDFYMNNRSLYSRKKGQVPQPVNPNRGTTLSPEQLMANAAAEVSKIFSSGKTQTYQKVNGKWVNTRHINKDTQVSLSE